MAGLRIDVLVVSLFQSNCLLVGREGSGEVIVVDPGDDADSIVEALARRDAVPVLYLLTHGHVDHVNALAAMVRAHPAPVALHPADAAWAFTPRAAFPPYYGPPEPPPGGIARDLADGQTWTDAGIAYTVIATPGHSPGGVCFHLEADKVLIAGDTLFRGSIGRSDLPGARPADLSRSLDRLLALPDDTRVYPGHGPDTTLGREKKTNPFLRDRSWAG